jgi:hypothetical protein
MNLKIFALAISFVIFSALVLSQAGIVNAVTNTNSPITAPITSATHILKGRVGIRIAQYIYPAIGVTVNVLNTKTNTVNSTKIDSMGQYSFNLAEGDYVVSIKDLPHVDFLTNEKTVKLNQNVDKVDFYGVWR